MQGMISVGRVGNLSRIGSREVTSGFPLGRAKTEIKEQSMGLVRRLWCEQEGQDIAEYAVMLAVILVIVVGTVRLIGSNANNVFSSVASSIQ
jgi:Flp pilus assembly pilin Flp